MQIAKQRAVFLLVTAAIVAAVLCGCDDQLLEEPRNVQAQGITNGSPTYYAEWTGAAGLLINNGQTLCTGTFVDPEVILTAAHCVHLDEVGVHVINTPNQIQIVGGSEALHPAIIYGLGGEIIVHPSWTGKGSAVPGAADAALIRLAAPPTNTPEIFPVRDTTPEKDETGWLVGYGNSSTNSGLGTHRKGQTTVLSYYGTGPAYLELGNPSGTCVGDSGGPFFTEVNGVWALSGITSFGAKQDHSCDPTKLNLSTNVANIYDWVADQVRAWTGRDVAVPKEADSEKDTGTGGDADTDTSAADTESGDSSGGDDDDTPPDYDRKGSSCSVSQAGGARSPSLLGLLAAVP